MPLMSTDEQIKKIFQNILNTIQDENLQKKFNKFKTLLLKENHALNDGGKLWFFGLTSRPLNLAIALKACLDEHKKIKSGTTNHFHLKLKEFQQLAADESLNYHLLIRKWAMAISATLLGLALIAGLVFVCMTTFILPAFLVATAMASPVSLIGGAIMTDFLKNFYQPVHGLEDQIKAETETFLPALRSGS